MGYCGIGVLRCWSVEVSGYRGFLLNLREPNGFLLKVQKMGKAVFSSGTSETPAACFLHSSFPTGRRKTTRTIGTWRVFVMERSRR
jgi:hypothetical protein